MGVVPLEIELEIEDDDLSLELELEWPCTEIEESTAIVTDDLSEKNGGSSVKYNAQKGLWSVMQNTPEAEMIEDS